MCQRFQIFVVTNDREDKTYTHGFHLQWCWGVHTLSRLHQMLKFGEIDCKRMYSDLRRFSGFVRDTKSLLKSLVSLNIYNSSFVNASELSESELEYDNPFVFDNDDGIFIVDYRYTRPKFALFKRDYVLNDDYGFVQVSALDYLKKYSGNNIKEYLKKCAVYDTEEELERIHNKFMTMVNYIDTFETLSEENMNNIFKNINKDKVDYLNSK